MDDGHPVSGSEVREREARQPRPVENAPELTPLRARGPISPQQRVVLLDIWERSGASAEEFGELVGVTGTTLYQWRKSMWFVLMALAIVGYLLILVDPANGYLSDDSIGPMIIGTVFLIGFGAVSLGTWAYFRFRPGRPDADRTGEVVLEG